MVIRKSRIHDKFSTLWKKARADGHAIPSEAIGTSQVLVAADDHDKVTAAVYATLDPGVLCVRASCGPNTEAMTIFKELLASNGHHKIMVAPSLTRICGRESGVYYDVITGDYVRDADQGDQMLAQASYHLRPFEVMADDETKAIISETKLAKDETKAPDSETIIDKGPIPQKKLREKGEQFVADQLKVGTEIEAEHKDAFEFVANSLKDTGKMPTAEEFFKMIRNGHTKEFKQYYEFLFRLNEDISGKTMDMDGHSYDDWGLEIETEHQPTYDFIKDTFEKTGNPPTADQVYAHIAQDHIDKYAPHNYYEALVKMEDELKKTEKKTKESSMRTLLNKTATAPEDVRDLLSIPSGGKKVYKIKNLYFTVYFDSETAQGDRGEKVPGMISGDYEVTVSKDGSGDPMNSEIILHQHVSPGKPGESQQYYAAERCIAAMLKWVDSHGKDASLRPAFATDKDRLAAKASQYVSQSDKSFKPNFSSADEFVSFLEGTFIPDLKRSGSEFVVEDFETVVKLLKSNTKDMSFEAFLRDTLIPDMKESGTEETAHDLEEFLYWSNKNWPSKSAAFNTKVIEDRIDEKISEIMNIEGGTVDRSSVGGDRNVALFKGNRKIWEGLAENAVPYLDDMIKAIKNYKTSAHNEGQPSMGPTVDLYTNDEKIWTGLLYDFFNTNSDMDDAQRNQIMDAINQTGEYRGGGGAAPEFMLKKVAAKKTADSVSLDNAFVIKKNDGSERYFAMTMQGYNDHTFTRDPGGLVDVYYDKEKAEKAAKEMGAIVVPYSELRSTGAQARLSAKLKSVAVYNEQQQAAIDQVKSMIEAKGGTDVVVKDVTEDENAFYDLISFSYNGYRLSISAGEMNPANIQSALNYIDKAIPVAEGLAYEGVFHSSIYGMLRSEFGNDFKGKAQIYSWATQIIQSKGIRIWSSRKSVADTESRITHITPPAPVNENLNPPANVHELENRQHTVTDFAKGPAPELMSAPVQEPEAIPALNQPVPKNPSERKENEEKNPKDSLDVKTPEAKDGTPENEENEKREKPPAGSRPMHDSSEDYNDGVSHHGSKRSVLTKSLTKDFNFLAEPNAKVTQADTQAFSIDHNRVKATVDQPTEAFMRGTSDTNAFASVESESSNAVVTGEFNYEIDGQQYEISYTTKLYFGDAAHNQDDEVDWECEDMDDEQIEEHGDAIVERVLKEAHDQYWAEKGIEGPKQATLKGTHKITSKKSDGVVAESTPYYKVTDNSQDTTHNWTSDEVRQKLNLSAAEVMELLKTPVGQLFNVRGPYTIMRVAETQTKE